jgi:hypothetical protein
LAAPHKKRHLHPPLADVVGLVGREDLEVVDVVGTSGLHDLCLGKAADPAW